MPYQGEGNNSVQVPSELTELHKHIWFDINKDRVVTDKAFETTLHTLWLSDQWGLGSGGIHPVLQSTDQKIDFLPIMSGVRKQYKVEYQGSDGLVHPFYRKFGDALQRGSLKGTKADTITAVTPYQGISKLVSNIAVFGVRAILGEPLALGDKLTYTIWKGEDDTGPMVFEQSLTVTADREVGFDFIGWWNVPAMEFGDKTVYARITLDRLGGGLGEALLVQATQEDPDVHWNELMFRTFRDRRMATEDDLGAIERLMFFDQDTIHEANGEAILWTNGMPIIWPLP